MKKRGMVGGESRGRGGVREGAYKRRRERGERRVQVKEGTVPRGDRGRCVCIF